MDTQKSDELNAPVCYTDCDKSIIKSANIHRRKVCLVKSGVAMYVIAFQYTLMGMQVRLFAFFFLNILEFSPLVSAVGKDTVKTTDMMLCVSAVACIAKDWPSSKHFLAM